MAKGRKTGGRQKGTPNRLTFQARMLLFSMLENEIEKIPGHLQSMEPRERVDVLIKFLPYLLPKLLPSDAGSADQFGLRPSSEVHASLRRKNCEEKVCEEILSSLSI